MEVNGDCIEAWDPVKHLELINSWYVEWGYPTWDASLYPKIGFVVNSVCVGFIFRSDALMCTIDGFVTSKTCNIRKKAHSLKILCEALVEAAKIYRVFCLQFFTNIPFLAKQGKRLGFTQVGSGHIHMIRRMR